MAADPMTTFSPQPREGRYVWPTSAIVIGIGPQPPQGSMPDLPFTIKDIRRSASGLRLELMSRKVSEFAGHESVSFTLKTYGHLYPTSGNAFIAKLDAAPTTSALDAEDEGMNAGHESTDDLAEVIPIGKKEAATRDVSRAEIDQGRF